MIYLDNGVSVFSGREYRCDPKRCVRDCVNLVSHGHFDHVPSSLSHAIVCSDITAAIVQNRTGLPVKRALCDGVELLDSGHVPGSTMFLIAGDKKILYTGDLCTRKKYCSPGAQPVDASVLIIESTFGKERYVFPPTEETIKAMRDWVDDNATCDRHSVIYAYTFGKAQEVISALSGRDVYTSSPVLKVNEVLWQYGHRLEAKKLPEKTTGDPIAIVASASGKSDPLVKKYISQGAKTAMVSGWAIDAKHGRYMHVDTAFPLSDHADYDELLAFTKAVNPEIVYTIHGFAKELARDITAKLGIDAIPLRKGHLTLSNFQ
ncbi:MAG TPA: MBL fold metallo-hydrolase [Methanocella sp.]|nr:MBL fold metallo-hydrolase [Methanocella sp.]